MKNDILILSIYPAPYRVALFTYMRKYFNTGVFFENSSGDGRNSEWFQQGDYTVIDTKEKQTSYEKMNISKYVAAVLYDYSTVSSIKTIIKCKEKGIPYIINCDGIIMKKHGNFIKDYIKTFLIRGAAACLASGENAEQYFRRYGAEASKIYKHPFSTLEEKDILKKPLNALEKRALREKLGLPHDKKIVIAVGRYISLKRYDYLLRAWDKMPKEYVLLLVGDGEQRKIYQKIIAEKQLANVILENYYPKEKLFEFYRSADLFIHPTSYDVWGLVINEALACGLPVVVSDHCVAGLELIKNGQNGELIAMGNEDSMCLAAKRILDNDSIRKHMANEAIKSIKGYTIERMAHSQITAIARIVNSNSIREGKIE